MGSSIGEEKAKMSTKLIFMVHNRLGSMPDKLYKLPYAFSTTIGESLTRKMMTFHELSEKLRIDVTQLMRECNGHAPLSRALVKGAAKELGIDEALLNRLAEEVRKDLG
jgi:hypothetical protein